MEKEYETTTESLLEGLSLDELDSIVDILDDPIEYYELDEHEARQMILYCESEYENDRPV